MGYDEQQRYMASYVQGGSVAAPIFKQFARKAFVNLPVKNFTAPNGVRLVRIDRKTGKRVYGGWPSDDAKSSVIWEAFKAETEPKRSIRQEEMAARGDKPKKRSSAQRTPQRSPTTTTRAQREAAPQTAAPAQREQEFVTEQGGIY
jgi:penicillin-binding protein 1A